MQVLRFVGAAVAAATLVASGFAAAQAPADPIAARHQQFRRLGAAFKSVNDELRAGSPDVTVIRTHAQTIASLSQALPSWFPPGSGPREGVRTRAKPEIWTNAAQFAERVRQFQASAQGLSGAGSDVAVLRTRARALGAECGRCHAAFREPE
jgi:cytochrome c556